jgi:[acyl-carrier-protein] S-malonyltransferase
MMTKNTIGFLFPAFGKGYLGLKPERLPNYQKHFVRFMTSASKIIRIDEEQFNKARSGIIEDDLQAHYACYINSCILSDILKEQSIPTDYIGPFSMGLYAAVYHASAVTFEDGLFFMHHQLTSALDALKAERYAMASIVGFTRQQLEGVLANTGNEVGFADTIDDLVHVVAGKKSEVAEVIQIARDMGSPHTRVLPVRLPYHTKFMRAIQPRVLDLLDQIEIRTPTVPVISTVNQKTLTTAAEIRREMSWNILQRVNWSKTMHRMLELQVNLFVECGPSKDLFRLIRKSAPNATAYHPKIYPALFSDFSAEQECTVGFAKNC